MEGRADRILTMGTVILSVILIAAQSGGLYLTKRATLERDYLHLPERWFELLYAPHVVPEAVLPSGGAASAAWPLSIAKMNYVAQPGDNLSRIKDRFGLTLDTLSSLNRDAGSGVHNVAIGEVFSIPNQDGLFLDVENRDHLETVAGDHGLSGSDVLAANPGVDVQSVSGSLFFPGAQHSGFERLLRMGLGFAQPLRGGWVSSAFGMRVDPFSGKWRMHRGIDIAASYRTRVRAAADGRVERVASNNVLGKFVVIDHQARSYHSLYAHLSSVDVRVGELVNTGTTIGRVGSTGMSTGPHLHFELWRRRQPINPASQVKGL